MRAAGIRSQAELSRKANLRPNTITRWIHGTTESPRPNDIGVVCRLLRVRPEWLSLGEGPMQADVVMETPAPYSADGDLTPAQRIALRTIRADIAKLSDKALEAWFARYQQVMDKAK